MITMLICALWGLYDLNTLIAIFASNGCMILFGLTFEVMNSNNKAAGRKVDWQSFYYGLFSGLVPWGLIYGAVMSSPGYKLGTLPWWIWAVLYTYIIMFSMFPLNMTLQYSQVLWWNDELYPEMNNGGYYFGEKVYQILSLTTKTLLVWFTVGGVI